MGRVTCLVRGCFSKAGEGIGMFKLPLDDKKRVKTWLLESNREDLLQKSFEDLSYFKICEHHFEKKFVIKGARHHLSKEAIPTIFHGLKRKRSTVLPDNEVNSEIDVHYKTKEMTSSMGDENSSTPMANTNVMDAPKTSENSLVTPGKRSHRCCVNGCNDLMSIRHRFPKREPHIFEAWIKIIKPSGYQSLSMDVIYNKYVVCDIHFRECDRIPKMCRMRGISAVAIPVLKIPGLDSEYAEAVIKEAIEKRDSNYTPGSIESNDACENIAIEFPDNYASCYQITDSDTNEEYLLDDRTGQLQNQLKIEEIPKCGECKQEAVGKSVINCDKGCGKPFHTSCVRLSRQNLDLLKIIDGATWFCTKCRNK